MSSRLPEFRNPCSVVGVLTVAPDIEVLVRFGRALADPIRCRILLALREAPAYPADLADALDVSRTRLSNHPGKTGALRSRRRLPGNSGTSHKLGLFAVDCDSAKADYKVESTPGYKGRCAPEQDRYQETRRGFVGGGDQGDVPVPAGEGAAFEVVQAQGGLT